MKKMKIIISIACAVLLLSLLSAGIFVSAQGDIEWSEISLQEEYSYGATLEIPSRTLSAKGKTYEASYFVILPNGSTSVSETLTLNQGGQYTIRYYVNDDVYYSKEEHFVVFDYLYSFNTDKSTAEYQEENGLYVSLADSDVMTFNTVIDLNDITAKDTLFSLIATPEEDGQYDFSRMYVTFTDVDDPTNYMTISIRRSTSNDPYSFMYSYLMGAADGQILTGVEGVTAPYKLHVEGTSVYGRPIQHSFSNALVPERQGTSEELPTLERVPNRSVTVSYDNETKELFTNNLLIIDLDNPEYFSAPWSGFKSGKVRMSISCALYEGAYASFTVKSVYGVDISSGKIDDTQGPEIKIDTKYADAMPYAAKGFNYYVPAASAKDANSGECEVQTVVWFNYNTDQKNMVSVIDGYFPIERVGTYAIEYTAEDSYGNKTVEVLYVVSKEKVDAPTITLDEIPVTEMKLGESILPVKYTATSGSGDASTSVVVKFEDEEVALTSNGFMPEKAGVYTVEYKVVDYIGQVAVESYTVNALANETPLYIDVPDFPLVLISGSEQSIPELYVNDYSSGVLEKVLVVPQITDSEGTRDVANNRIKPVVANNGDKITLTYTYKGSTLTKEIPTVSVWSVAESGRPMIDLQYYLYSAENNIGIEKTEQSIIVSALEEDASFVFANKLYAENFEMVFNSLAGSSKYGAVKLSFIDSEYNDIAFDVVIVNNGNKGADVIVGENSSTISSSVAAGSRFNLYYSDKQIKVGLTTINVTTCLNGEAFNGFVSDTVYLKVSFIDATAGEDAAIALESINGHAMTNLTSDRTAPKIVVCGEYGGAYKLNSSVTIPKCLIGDVLDPNSTATITVTDPEGNIVTSVDGVALKDASPYVENTLTLTQYGQYKVVITAKDTFNSRANEVKLAFIINVVDDTAPTVKLDTEMSESAKVGDILILPNLTVEDNITPTENIVVMKYVYTPTGRLITLEGNSNSITASFEGVYEFRIYVRDAEGNVTFMRKSVTVTKEGVANE